MTRSDVALLLAPLPLSPLLLALAACASEPERAGRSGEPRPSPFRFEMASAAALGEPMRYLEGGIATWEEAGQPVDNR